MALFARLLVVGTALLGVAVAAPASASAALSLAPSTPLVADANNDGVIGPGDTLSISETVTNNGADVTGLQATLTSLTTGVHVVAAKSTSSYPDIALGGTGANTTPFQVTIDDASVVMCGTTLNFSLSFTSSAGPATVTFTVPTGALGGFADYSGSSAIIGDTLPTLRASLTPGIYDATAPVGSAGIVRAVRVHLANLTHDNIGHLKLELVAPDGTRATLIDHRGSATEAFGDTELVQSGAALSAPFIGTFQADGNLGALVNTSQQGTWHLAITADDHNELGHLDGWTLSIAKADCSPRSFAKLQVPDRVDPGASVELDASDSTTVAPGGITQYDWDFGNASFTQSTFAPTTGKVTHSFATRGHYTLRVQVRDSGGIIGIATKDLIVSLAPIASIDALATDPKQGVNVQLDGSHSSDPDLAGLNGYEWDLDYDGANFTTDATGQTPTVQFATAGPRTIALRVTDVDGATGVDTLAVDVLPTSAPTAAVVATPNPTVVGTPVIFDASASTDSDGTIVAYAWDLDGNGSFETATGTSPLAGRVYPNAGVANVGLRVTDNDGKASIAHVALVVKAAPGAPAPGPITGGGAAPGSAGGGGSGTNGGVDGPAAGAKLSAALAGSAIQALKLVTKKGLGLRCSADRAVTCSVTAALQPADARRLGLSRSRTKAYVLGRASVRLTKAGAATVTVRVSRRVLAKLKRARRVTVLVTGTAVDGHGGQATLRRAVLVRR